MTDDVIEQQQTFELDALSVVGLCLGNTKTLDKTPESLIGLKPEGFQHQTL